MNYSAIFSALKQASAFDLFRLRAAIDRVLDQPDWVADVQKQLQIGQQISYFDPTANRAVKAQVIKKHRKHVWVLLLDTPKHLRIPYAAVNLNCADVAIHDLSHQTGLSQHSLAVGDVVGFIDSNQQPHSGRILRLNGKTVTLQVGRTEIRVAYGLLQRS